MNKQWERQFAHLDLVKRYDSQPSTIVRVLDIEIGGPDFVVMAGPCSVENERQTLVTAEAVREAGATVTEAMAETDVDLIAEYADIIQVGSRNMENSSLLEAVSRCGRPILLKRGLTARLEDLLTSAEMLLAGGNPNIILCERGIRTFETATRNTLDISAVPVLHALTHLPVIVDPSHAAGVRQLVPVLARTAVAADADGLIVEVHPSPEDALSDGEQSLTFPMFRSMMFDLAPYVALRAANREAQDAISAGRG